MSPSGDLDRGADEPRGPHTLYLTRRLWGELERRYLEQRLAGGTLSKIAYLEQLLWAGLGRPPSGDGVPQPPPARSRAVAPLKDQNQEKVGAAPRPLTPPPGPDQVPVPGPPTSETTSRPEPPRPDPPRRSGALDRLRQASDPGRPTQIDSAAPIRQSAQVRDS
ncbi:MAG: hypothetical protein M3256_02865 [Actinomycetota bacterium]|nr:hypothetical protein [Actinomycetota bacterium]